MNGAAPRFPEDDAVDLSSCAREPIRTPGSIQPCGALLVMRDRDRRISHASANLGVYLDRPLSEVLGMSLTSAATRVDEAAAAVVSDGVAGRPARVELQTTTSDRVVDVFAHRRDDRIVVELEDVGTAEASASFAGFQDDVRQTIGALQSADSVEEMLNLAVEVVQAVTGFDRVMAYRFEPDGHGVVASERRLPELPPFLGLHYPASDIPAQARELYRRQWLRGIADSSSTPIEIIAAPGEALPGTLNLEGAVLRAVSPVHMQYLRNMGVKASLSVSLIVGGELWGLIACHHYAVPQRVPYRVRAACEVVGLTASMSLATHQQLEHSARRLALQRAVDDVLERVAGAASIADGIVARDAPLLGVCEADGAAVMIDGDLRLVGRTPSAADVERIIETIGGDLPPGAVYATDVLAVAHPELSDLTGRAAGVMAISLSRSRGNYVLWFRPEQVRTINWAGNPGKPVQIDADGASRLGPRRSFELWAESVRGRSDPWDPAAREAVGALRSALGSFVLERVEQLARMNAELARSNAELDAFAYAAAHDLKEPLRGIYNFAGFLIEDYADLLDEPGRAHVQTIMRLSDRMSALLDSLLTYSRLGRAELHRRPVDARRLIANALESLSPAVARSGAVVTIEGGGVLVCDPARIEEVLTNLLSNAIKYTRRATPHIVVRVGPCCALELQPQAVRARVGQNPALTMVSVCDDGIGIAPDHLEDVFHVFRRLHDRDAYGGGTGAGLTICRRIVERHDGLIWIDSAPDQGTCVHFVLGR